ncbi:unnamed protein product [Diamesa serratosioi]
MRINKLLETFNTSDFDFPKEIWYILPTHEIVMKITTLVPLAVFGILGNSLLINVILTNRSLRTPTNYLIMNMAIADLFVLLIGPGMFLFHDFFQDYKLGPIGCKTEGMMEGSLLVTAVLSLCLISYDRLTAITLPTETRLNLKGAKIAIFLTWTVGLILAAPLSVFREYSERNWKNFLETFCAENPNILPLYWHILTIALVYIPLVVLVISYSMIFWKLDRYEQARKQREHPMTVCYKKKFAKTMFIVLISFFLLRLPFTTLVFIRTEMLKNSSIDQVDGSFQVLWYVSHYLIYVNAALTPIIYGLTNENYRRSIRQSLWYKHLCCCKSSSMESLTRTRVFICGTQNNAFNLEPRNPIVLNKQLKRNAGGWNIVEKTNDINVEKTTTLQSLQTHKNARRNAIITNENYNSSEFI